MTVSEVSKLCGITVRTLQYYHRIGLLAPSRITPAGYRLYEEDALERLQQILFYRELGFPLEEIKAIVQRPDFDRVAALQSHRTLLEKQRQRLDGLIALVDKSLKGEDTMSVKEFDMREIEAAREQYAAEAKERWGDTDAYAASQAKTASYTSSDWQEVQQESEGIMAAFGQLRQGDPTGAEAQKLVERWQQHITSRFYPCTNEILAGLGLMYEADQRFIDSIDQHGPGTAAFMAAAIRHYCR